MSGLWIILLEIALIALVLALLNARDRRRARAMVLVLDVLDTWPRPLRTSITLHARGRVLSRRVVVALDMADCERADVLAALRPLADALPPHVALVIGARLDRTLSVAVSVAARGRRTPAPLGLS
jgi:acetyl esterase/lipase